MQFCLEKKNDKKMYYEKDLSYVYGKLLKTE